MADNDIGTVEFKHQQIATFGDCTVFLYQASSHTNGILYTKGLSAINQHELAGKADQVHPFIELYFFLPSYWDFEKEQHQWPLSVLERLIQAQTVKKVWFSPGDTLPAHPVVKVNGLDGLKDKMPPINNKFAQNYFMLAEPIAAQSFLKALEKEGDSFIWLSIIPIFQREFDYKCSRSALELLLNFDKKKITELIDEHRPLGARKKFFGLF